MGTLSGSEIPTYRELAEKLKKEEQRSLRLAKKIVQLERSLSRARTIEATKAQFNAESG